MTTTEEKFRQALEQIYNNDYRAGRHTAIDIVLELRKIARDALAQADADAALDPFSVPGGERMTIYAMHSLTERALEALLDTLELSIDRQCQRITAAIKAHDATAEVRARAMMLQANITREMLVTILDTNAQLEREQAALDPFSGPRGERVRQELLAEARAEGRDRND